MDSSCITSITYVKAKNGQDTCLADNRPLHSLYNPENEAKQFVNAQINTINYIPSNIVISGIIFPYCISYIKKYFPNCRVSSIFYSKQIIADNQFDKVFYISTNLSEELYQYLTEEHYSDTLFISWKPAETIYPKEYKETWNQIKDYINKSSQIIATRIFFSHKWIYNSINFLLNEKNKIIFSRSNLPVLLICSGTTLKDSIPYIKKHENDFFILCVSSAITVLLKNNITPDLCISTDGGFYASKHLYELHRSNISKTRIPLAISSESMIPSFIYTSTPIVYLKYSDEDIEKPEYLSTDGYIVRRNGTVSGTAYDLARQVTNNKIYAIGLDLALSKGFQHTQPNELELDNSKRDNRLSTMEHRQSVKQFASGSMETYAKWFESQSNELDQNFARLKTREQVFSRNLMNIEEINWEDINIPSNNKIKDNIFHIENKKEIDCKKIANNIQNLLINIKKDKESKEINYWLKSICLYEYLQNKKYMTKDTKNKMKEKSISFLTNLLTYIQKNTKDPINE